MPTTPPEKVPKQQATATKRGHRPPGKRPKPWWISPWIPLGPIVAGLALCLGFHMTLRLWELTKTHEPLDLSPPFAAKPLPGTSLDNLIHRYGNQLPPLLTPTTSPDRPAPLPPVLPQGVTARGMAVPAIPSTTPEDREDRPTQDQTTLAAPPLLRPAPSIPVEPSASEFTIPPPPLGN